MYLRDKPPQITHCMLYPSLSLPCKLSRKVTFSPYIKIKQIPSWYSVSDTSSFSPEPSLEESEESIDIDISGSSEGNITNTCDHNMGGAIRLIPTQ